MKLIRILEKILKSINGKPNKPPIGHDYLETFENIYKCNYWNNDESISGPGSTLFVTKSLINKLSFFISKYSIETVFDIPCGDFNWMKNVIKNNTQYLGGDIVYQLIANNQTKYGKDNIRFIQFDIINYQLKKLSKFDLLLIRDCFVHFSYYDIRRALINIIESENEYILMTTFTKERKNENIITGYWRPINFNLSPFNFPPPIEIINENSENGDYSDKSLGLWRVCDIKKSKFIANKNM